MIELTPKTVPHFLKRFNDLHDALVRVVTFRFGPSEKIASVILSAQDTEADKLSNWVNIRFEMLGVTDLVLREGFGKTCVVIFKMNIGFMAGNIYLDFSPWSEAPVGIEDYRKSDFLIVARRCSWCVLPYADTIDVEEFGGRGT